MGLPVLIYGKSGSGKSRSLKFFDEDEIVLLNTEKKELPFRKRFKKTGCSDDINKIIATINKNVIFHIEYKLRQPRTLITP